MRCVRCHQPLKARRRDFVCDDCRTGATVTHQHYCPSHGAWYDCQCAEPDADYRTCGPCLDQPAVPTPN